MPSNNPLRLVLTYQPLILFHFHAGKNRGGDVVHGSEFEGVHFGCGPGRQRRHATDTSVNASRGQKLRQVRDAEQATRGSRQEVLRLVGLDFITLRLRDFHYDGAIYEVI